MSDVTYERPSNANRTTTVETVEFRFLVAVLFVFSALILLGSRMLGRKHQMPFWKEVKSTACATAGYAFKY